MIDAGPRKAISGGRSGRVISDDRQAERTLARCRLCGPSEWPGAAGLLRLTLGTVKILCLGGGEILQSPPGRSDLESFSARSEADRLAPGVPVCRRDSWLVPLDTPARDAPFRFLHRPAAGVVAAAITKSALSNWRPVRFRASGSNSAARRESVRRPAVGGHGCREEGCRTKSVFILDVDRIPPSGAGWVCLFSH